VVYSPTNPWTFPVNPNFPWLPQAQIISSISNSNPAIIVTMAPHGYSTGFNLRIFFPYTTTNIFGMQEIAERTGVITVLSDTSFSIDIDTTHFQPFTQGTREKAQVIPISQYENDNNLDFVQVNPVNPQSLEQVVTFQQSGLQAGGPCSTSQT
jgi:hypothetical protein